jgi:hypothetical protein
LPDGTKTPDFWAGEFPGNVFFHPTLTPGRAIYTIDIDEMAREIRIGGDRTYCACYRLVGSYAGRHVLFRNYSSLPDRRGFAVAFPKSSATPDTEEFSDSGDKVHFKTELVSGSQRQERAFSLNVSQVPADAASVDATTLPGPLPINGALNDQLVWFDDFSADDYDQLYLFQYSDNYIRL